MFPGVGTVHAFCRSAAGAVSVRPTTASQVLTSAPHPRSAEVSSSNGSWQPQPHTISASDSAGTDDSTLTPSPPPSATEGDKELSDSCESNLVNCSSGTKLPTPSQTASASDFDRRSRFAARSLASSCSVPSSSRDSVPRTETARVIRVLPTPSPRSCQLSASPAQRSSPSLRGRRSLAERAVAGPAVQPGGRGWREGATNASLPPKGSLPLKGSLPPSSSPAVAT